MSSSMAKTDKILNIYEIIFFSLSKAKKSTVHVSSSLLHSQVQNLICHDRQSNCLMLFMQCDKKQLEIFESS